MITTADPLAIGKQLGLRRIDWRTSFPSAMRATRPPTRILLVGDPESILDETEHLDLLRQFLGKGYDPVLRTGRSATRESVIDALEDESYAGIYIFAHGAPAEKHLPPRILLPNDERFLSGADLPSVFAGRPFIFLNSCWLGRNDWSESVGATDSLAGEFLRRGASAVVGAICPITTDQAARAATIFFHEVLLASTIGQALGKVRSDSYRQYAGNRASLAWFAYRLYGDPDSCLASSVWNSDGTLRKEAFSVELAPLGQSMERHRRLRDSAVFSPADLMEAVAEINTSGGPALPTRTLVRFMRRVSVAFSAATRLLPREERLMAAAPLLRESNDDLRLVFAELLQTHQNRLRASQRFGMHEFPLDAPAIVDACAMPSVAFGADLEELSGLTEQQALETIRALLTDLTILPHAMSTGAAIVIHDTLRNALLAGSSPNFEQALLAAFLQHPLIGSPWASSSVRDTSLIRDRLILLSAVAKPGSSAVDVTQFVSDLLARALEIAAGKFPIDERTLFQALCELTGRNFGLSALVKHADVT